jgi:threonine/homoserine/homoserine lactone efflux protein
MLSVLIQGILLGLTIAILMGPAFFTLIQTSIHRGFRSGLFFALGVLLSDTTIVTLCVLGLSQLISGNNKLFGIIGGIILIIFGVFTFTRKIESFAKDDNDNGNNKPAFFTFILKGYFLNIANPILIFFWMGVTGGVISGAGTGPGELFKHVMTFFSGALLTIFSTDMLKCFIANKIKTYLNPKVLIIINHTIGVILVLFGIFLILRVVIFKSV